MADISFRRLAAAALPVAFFGLPAALLLAFFCLPAVLPLGLPAVLPLGLPAALPVAFFGLPAALPLSFAATDPASEESSLSSNWFVLLALDFDLLGRVDLDLDMAGDLEVEGGVRVTSIIEGSP